ncbi:hypothetical protein EG339_02810 [Chryseobacterium bernardetii]|uniref:Uncharacterized protein n=1 Tax=Chryseobacterium bernardetii TaxID=1241978 RepID=A0A3G6T708_9FLAO|nr:hypothetical protein [Chryseobacterium bernardetii]AZB23627.1 hypothetical protein EG339_02810 [Chryseobacterium bernardetii]
MKKKTIKIPIYFGDFIIILDQDDWKNVNEMYQHRLGWTRPADKSDEAFVFEDHYNGYSRYIVCFKRRSKNSVIAHECVHLVNKLFKDRGQRLDIENDEAQAYMTGWFFEQIENFFINQK